MEKNEQNHRKHTKTDKNMKNQPKHTKTQIFGRNHKFLDEITLFALISFIFIFSGWICVNLREVPWKFRGSSVEGPWKPPSGGFWAEIHVFGQI